MYREIYKDLSLAAHRSYDRGLQLGSGGNISARIPETDSMIIKSAGGSLGDCTEKGVGWVAVNFAGQPLAGQIGSPSKEWRLHAALLKALPQTGGIVHTHSVYSISWAQEHEQIPLCTWHSRLKLIAPIPVIDIPSAVVPEEELGRIVGLFKDEPRLQGFVLRGHGLVALGRTAAEAQHMAELIEETAKVNVLQRLLGKG